VPVSSNLKRDLFALGLLALVVFLGAALVTYDPADPVVEPVAPLNLLYQPDQLVTPANSQVHNVCGRWGAMAADMLLSACGLAAWYVVGSLGVLDLTLLRRRAIDTPILRAFGWTASIIGLTTILAMVAPTLSPGPVIGPGGYLGALGRSLVELHFAHIGGLILAGSLTLGGLLLATDYALFRFGSFAAKVAVAGAASASAKLKRKKQARTDLDAPVPGGEGLAVKIRGKKVTRAELEAEEVDEEDELVADGEAGSLPYDGDEEPDVIPVKKLGLVAAQKEKEKKAAAADPKTRQDGPENPLRVKSPTDRKREAAERSPQDEVRQRLDEASIGKGADDYKLPELDLLLPADDVNFEAQAIEVRRKAKILEKTFLDFGFTVKVVEIETGPVIAQYEVELEAGLRLSKITGLSDDLAIALRVPSVRIVAPIPGKNTVGIEVPNEQRQVVRLREVIEEANGKTKKMRIPIFLGKDVSGNPLVVDLSTLPHLLIAGRTGTGKSVCLNAIISSMLMTRRPDEVRMLMIDPKMVELSGYARLPHLMHPVVTDMRKAEAILAWAVEKMEERYALLARVGVRHISSYNQLGEEEIMDRLQPETDDERKSIPLHLPFIVIVADEIADLMMTSGKEVEQHIIRLAQKSRAVGIHLILATQKPTVDVITGLIKSNLPARIAFQVASRTDSRVVLDEMGADKLLGNGDMLFLWPGTSTLLRGQGTYLSDEEINKIVDCVSTGEQHFVNELVNMKVTKPGEPGEDRLAAMRKKDDMYESAVDVVIREGRGSVSLLQRALGIGYGRAARLIDFMAEDGIVGQYAGSQAREVIISVEEWEAMQAGVGAEEPKEKAGPFNANSTPAKKRNNKVRLNEIEAEEESDEAADADDDEAEAESQVDAVDDEEEEDAFADSDYEAESA
jgi:S-DNA-T family DNA segregation ATPase FtsK/SpoIIIE